jgi:hypothetical protein
MMFARSSSSPRPATRTHFAPAVARRVLAAALALGLALAGALQAGDHAGRPADVTAADLVTLGGASVAGILERPGEADFFYAELSSTARVQFRAELGSMTDSVLTVLAADGTTVLAENDDVDLGDRRSRAELTPTTAGRVYVRIAHFSREHGTGSYSVSMSPAPTVVTTLDDYPDTALTGARSDNGLTADDPGLTGTLERAGDLDVFFFQASRTRVYELEVQPGTLGDPAVEVLGPDGETVLAASDDAGGTLAPRVSRFRPPALGTYFARVRHTVDRGRGTYRIVLRSQVIAPDDRYVTSPELSQRVDQTMLLDKSIEADLEVAGDVDLFAFEAVASRTAGLFDSGVELEPGFAVARYSCTLSSKSDTPVQVEILAPDGRTILGSATTETGPTAVAAFEPQLSATYYVRVSALPPGGLASYTLGLERSTIYEFGVGSAGSPDPAPQLSLTVGSDAASAVATVRADGDPASLALARGQVNYDPIVLAFTSAEPGPAAAGDTLTVEEVAPGTLEFSLAVPAELQGRLGQLIRFRFARLLLSLPPERLVALRSYTASSRTERRSEVAPAADAGPDRQLDWSPDRATIPDPLDAVPGTVRRHVRLDGRGSADPGLPARPLTYRWTVLSAPQPVVLSDPASPVPTFAPQAAGTYQLGLVVDNGTLPSLQDRVSLLVRRLNHPPTAQARARRLDAALESGPGDPPLDAPPGAAIQFDGRYSVDLDRDDAGHLTYRWRQLEGPAVALTPSSTAAAPRFTPASSGLHLFELLVADPQGAESLPFSLGVEVRQPPGSPTRLSLVSSASTTPGTGQDFADDRLEGSSASLRVQHGSRVLLKAVAVDPDVAVPPLKHRLEFRWTQLSGPPVEVETSVFPAGDDVTSALSFEATTSRVLLFRCEAIETDAANVPTGARAARRLRLVVEDPRARTPIARVSLLRRPLTKLGSLQAAAAETEPFRPGETVVLDGSGSTPFTTGLLAFSWSQLEGPQVTLSNPFSAVTTFALPDPRDQTIRTYAFQLLVDDGLHTSEPLVVRLDSRPPPPVSTTVPPASGACLLSLPLDPSTTGHPFEASDLAAMLGAQSLVLGTRLEPATSRARLSALAGPGVAGPHALKPGEGLIVFRGHPAAAGTTLTGLAWPGGQSELWLEPGLNLIGYPATALAPPETAQDLLARAGTAGRFAVRGTPSPTGTRFEVYLPGGRAWPVEPGGAYLLSVSSRTRLLLPSGP